MTLLTNPRAMMATISSVIAMILMIFFITILSDHLIEIGVQEMYIGYVLALNCAMYAAFSPIVGYLCIYIKKIFLTQVSFLLCCGSLILMGPSEFLNLPDKLSFLISGMACLGISTSFIFVPLLPEIIDAVKEKERMVEDSISLNDKAAGLFNTACAVGCLFAPILGGALNEKFGFR